MSNTLLKVASGILLIAVAAMIAFGVYREKQIRTDLQQREAALTDSQTIDENTTADELSKLGEGAAANIPALAAGIIGDVPTLETIPKVDAFPWRDALANRLYSNARSRRCGMLIPGLPVRSGLQHREGRLTTIGRIPAISISLELDESAKDKMPRITQVQTENYLAKHRLVIEPILYHDRRGTVYFGTDCRAAFFEKDRPLVTVKSEAMIDQSVGNFLALGLFQDQGECDGRTLIMSFRYAQSDPTLTGLDAAKKTTECLILHLRPDATPDNPIFDVFATTEGRQQIHQLVRSSNLLTDPTTSIRAGVRFDRFVMMGLYPASPVVTDVRLNTDRTMPSAKAQLLMRQGPADDRPGLQDILDDFAGYVADDSIDARLLETFSN
ncbi:hypothetical protein [Crateriforma conspicua]|uniref:Uncharacterized protein n=1 Tax=Crateriforma conspicua TaxID=2527996 RepID=A0A5C6FY36_9PLAN|nr:hypothetical protein [Crateriforma conspicua]TWU66238.1 hypothetical protein V7x_18000 [Crateriforma conspicua]